MEADDHLQYEYRNGSAWGNDCPDKTTFEYIKDRDYAPSGQLWEEALAYWSTLYTDDDAVFNKEYVFNAKISSQ